MFNRPRSFSVLYGIQRNFLTLFYLISVVAVFWAILYILYAILGAGGKLIIPVAIFYLVIIVLGYSILQVISYIPANLAGAFDPIKNRIALGEINSGSGLASELANFVCNFFDFAFFDIQSASVCFRDGKPEFSSDLGLQDFEDSAIKSFAEALEEASLFGKISTPKVSGYMYVIPIIFGGNRLGYFAIVTRQKLWKIFIQLLNEFENDFVDDQVVHVLAGEVK